MFDDEHTLDSSVASGESETLAERREPEYGHEPERGAQVGRYVILSKLGAGAMGVVLAAYDPELDRKVALKLLKTREREDGSGRARLRREAQALAKLDHRNVVRVHDVGEHEGQSFVGMEFVAGMTLGDWMAQVEHPRPWREILAVFREAGRGLAAAHEQGLVHRDFKPDNVMLGDDGRVRVMDFGLARTEAETETETEPKTGSEARGGGKNQAGEGSCAGDDALSRPRTGSHDDQLTQTGMLLGTPAYMSLELFKGHPADPRSDQFGFCVALYEALYGERPFAGRGLGNLVYSLENEAIREPPRASTVPSWLRRVVLRGLARAPTQRWDSMQALLEALATDPAFRRRRWLGVAGLSALLIGGVSAMAMMAPREPPVCAGMGAKLAGVWDTGRRIEIEAAISGTGLSYAQGTWERVARHLDDYTNAWVEARVEACQATERGEQSGELLDLQMACLDERLVHVRAAVEELAQIDAALVEQAVVVVTALPSLTRCGDLEALTSAVPVPEDPALAEQIATLEGQLVGAQAKQSAGRYDEALAVVQGVVARGQGLGYEPLMARAWLQEGSLHDRQGDYERAETTLRLALDAALAQGLKSEAAAASALLIRVVGNEQSRFEAGEQWAQLAASLARAEHTQQAQAIVLDERGSMAVRAAKLDEGQRYHEQALALRREFLPPDHTELGDSLHNLGMVAVKKGDYTKAAEYWTQALALKERALGPEHPDLARMLNNLGSTAYYEGRLADAHRHWSRSLTIKERALGPEHPSLGRTLGNLGTVAHAEGDYATATAYSERALAIATAAFGPTHQRTAVALNNLGGLAYAERDYARAQAYYGRALEVLEAALGPDHPELAGVLGNLGALAGSLEDWPTAQDYNRRSLAIREAALEPDHPKLAAPLTGLGLVLVEQGEFVEALAVLERALDLRGATPGDALDLAETQFGLAVALWSVSPGRGRDRIRAQELARLARAAYVESGPLSTEELADVDAWLADPGGSKAKPAQTHPAAP